MFPLRLFSILIGSAALLSCYQGRKATSGEQIPSSDFSHIMPVIDSAAFDIMRQDSFLTNTFSFAENDTMMTTVFSLYLWGQNHFLHFSPDKGYFKNQAGTAYIIFQSNKPGVGDVLKQAWQKHTQDSLISYDFEGPDFVLTEIIGARHASVRKTKTNHLIPMLSSYSPETYKRWGLPDSSNSTVSDFIKSVNRKAQNKLFNSIQSVDLVVTNAELELLRSMLMITGYKHQHGIFTRSGQPAVNYVVDERPGKSKLKKINILLSEETPARIINLGETGQITFRGKHAAFVFH